MVFVICISLIIILFILLNLYCKFKINNLKLAKNYHNNYDSENALKYYDKSLKDGNILVLIDIATIYQYGLGNQDINLFKAFQNYYVLLLLLKNKDDPLNNKYKLYIRNKIKDILESINLPEEDTKNNDKPVQNLNIDNFLLDNILDQFNKNTLFSNQPIRIQENTIPNTIPNIIPNIRIPNILNDINNYAIVDTPPVYNPILNDKQNIHDTFINNTISNSINNIINDTNNNLQNLNIDDINIIIQNELNNTKSRTGIDVYKKQNILKVLERINISDTKSIKNNMTSKEALVLVFNRIYNKNDDNIKQTFLSNLMNELNDCVENNNIVCHTGIFNRIFNSINLLDEDVTLKSYDYLNEEIMNKCAIIRNNFDELDNEENNSDTLLKNKIRDEIKKDYVDTKILTQEQLNDMLNIWIDHI
jgi:hypothetical protein